MKHKIFIISGVSGAGKGTIINGVLKTAKFDLARGINVTTRPKEKRDKKESHFQYVSHREFKEMIKKDELLEYDFHFQNYYGVNRKILEELLKDRHIILEADVNGGLEIKKKLKNVVLIYLIADNRILEKRVERRGEENEEEIRLRMKRAELENQKSQNYDYQVENPEGHPEVAIDRVEQIIRKELNNK